VLKQCGIVPVALSEQRRRSGLNYFALGNVLVVARSLGLQRENQVGDASALVLNLAE